MGTTVVAERRRSGAVARVAALLLVAVIVAACSNTPAPSSAPGAGTVPPANQGAPKNEATGTAGGTLRMAMANEIDGLNPIQARWSIDGNMIGSSIFDSLLTFDENRKLVPRLATSVTPDAAGTTWTIKLRPGVTFHDGTALDATVVKKNIEARKAQPITGGALDPIDTVIVSDPQTVVVKMKTPWFGYDYTLAAQGGYMVAAAQIDDPNSMRKAIGAGPFRQVAGSEYAPGQPVKLERNPDYWGDKPFLDGITFTAIVDENGRVNALKAHDVDMILTQDAENVRGFRSDTSVKEVEDVAAEEGFAMLNLAAAPFDNMHARKALAYATNSQEIVDTIGEGVLQPAQGPFIAGERFYSEESGYPGFDLDKAKAEVEAYKNQTGQATFAFTISAPPGEQKAATLLQAQWALAGAEVKIDITDQTVFLTNMFVTKFQVAMFRNFAYVNPDSNYIFWHSSQAKGVGTGSINFGQLKSPELDKALDVARANPDEASRTEQYKRITPTLNASLPYIWTYHNDWALIADQKVGGLGYPQQLGFGRQDAKPWWNQIWLQQ